VNDSYHLSELEAKHPELEFIYDQDLSLVGISETREEKVAEEVPAEGAAVAATPAKAPAGKKD